MSALPRPAANEHPEYYGRYIALVPDGDIVDTLRRQLGDTLALLEGVPMEVETYRYADDKWTVREVIGHIIDVERIFGFRALMMARCDEVDLPGIEQNEWAANSNAGARPLGELLEEWRSVRTATCHLFASLNAAAGARTGKASGFLFTVRTFPWIIAGHELWHRQILRERYLRGEAA